MLVDEARVRRWLMLPRVRGARWDRCCEDRNVPTSHRLEIGRMDLVGEYTVLEAADYECWITSSRIPHGMRTPNACARAHGFRSLGSAGSAGLSRGFCSGARPCGDVRCRRCRFRGSAPQERCRLRALRRRWRHPTLELSSLSAVVEPMPISSALAGAGLNAGVLSAPTEGTSASSL